ncbi:uncharacterized protein EDB93DRAFT_1081328 [Suillus bovinus]|uniref:uncharacterized protein n=1 Tax=Suillus bovinus TaxID=48563 RepID=UPI001B86E8D8|nr:uncharacterized protein EDB93DRAFT_1081328 [Suillus bovinus]KAG2154510.1 hypothetical protein EDB93DRAFT_1081328 [Suillus bovinus]
MHSRTPSLNLAALPDDLLFEVTSCLSSRTDILNLALSSKYLFTSTCSALYAQVHLGTAEQCQRTLSMLRSRPDVARHIQKLHVRFSSASSDYMVDVNGITISALLRELAPKLDALHTFIWDADEIPQCDDMWFALRMSCPRLRTLGTCYGSVIPSQRSHLLEFKNLRGFSLSLKYGYYAHHTDDFQDAVPFDVRLWDMLIRRSPNLEELHVLGGPLILDGTVHPLCNARWPLLHSLSLGDVMLDWSSGPGPMSSKRPFIAFLEAHQRLRSLRISRTALSPHVVPSLDQSALPLLTHFTGSLEHLQALAPSHPQITHLTIEEPLIIRDLAPLLIAGVLQSLRCLTELRVAFVFHSSYESANLIRNLVSTCPGLTTLEITCARRSSFKVVCSFLIAACILRSLIMISQDTLAKSVSYLPRLRHLRLTLVPVATGDSLRVCALHVIQAIPRLHSFALTFISASLPLSLTPVDFGMYEESGNYVVRADEHGLPHSLSCTERRPALRLPFTLPIIPIPLAVPLLTISPFTSPSPRERKMRTQRFLLNLYPITPRHGGLGLILERSTAGDEARVLTVLVALSGLALWGFFA